MPPRQFHSRLCFYDTEIDAEEHANGEPSASLEVPIGEGTILRVASGGSSDATGTKLTLRTGWQEIELTAATDGAEEDATMRTWREEIERAIAGHIRAATRLYNDVGDVSGGGASLPASDKHAGMAFTASPIRSARIHAGAQTLG